MIAFHSPQVDFTFFLIIGCRIFMIIILFSFASVFIEQADIRTGLFNVITDAGTHFGRIPESGHTFIPGSIPVVAPDQRHIQICPKSSPAQRILQRSAYRFITVDIIIGIIIRNIDILSQTDLIPEIIIKSAQSGCQMYFLAMQYPVGNRPRNIVGIFGLQIRIPVYIMIIIVEREIEFLQSRRTESIGIGQP